MRNAALLSIALCVSTSLVGVKEVSRDWKSEIYPNLERGGHRFLNGVQKSKKSDLRKAMSAYKKAFRRALKWYGCDPQQGARLTLLGSMQHAVDGHALAWKALRNLTSTEKGPCSLTESLN